MTRVIGGKSNTITTVRTTEIALVQGREDIIISPLEAWIYPSKISPNPESKAELEALNSDFLNSFNPTMSGKQTNGAGNNEFCRPRPRTGANASAQQAETEAGGPLYTVNTVGFGATERSIRLERLPSQGDTDASQSPLPVTDFPGRLGTRKGLE